VTYVHVPAYTEGVLNNYGAVGHQTLNRRPRIPGNPKGTPRKMEAAMDDLVHYDKTGRDISNSFAQGEA
jgi:hypothetical protein